MTTRVEHPCPNYSSGSGAGCETKVSKNSGLKEASGAAPFQDFRNAFTNLAVNAPHLLHTGLLSPARGYPFHTAKSAGTRPNARKRGMRSGDVSEVKSTKMKENEGPTRFLISLSY